MLLLFLLLWFVTIGVPAEQEEEGVEVSFGVAEEGGGDMAEQSESMPVPAPEPAPAPSAEPAPQQQLMTQEDEEALALARQKEENERRARAEAEAERRRLQAEADAKAKAEAEARAKAEAERKAKQDTQIAKANAMGSLFGNSGTQGSGDSHGADQKGSAVGHGSVGSAGWALAGRAAKSIPAPGKEFTAEGTVVVRIEVNAAGNVTNAQVYDGTTTSDRTLRELALQAARQATFTPSESPKQVGTITYHFKQK